MSLRTVHQLVLDFLTACGIDNDNVRSVEFRATVGERPTVTVTRYVDDADPSRIRQTYNLAPRPVEDD